jgi:hypothetical protein
MADADTKPPAPPKVKPRTDAYTGMLVLSLLILIAGCVLLFLDYRQYPTTNPPKVKSGAPAGQQK